VRDRRPGSCFSAHRPCCTNQSTGFATHGVEEPVRLGSCATSWRRTRRPTPVRTSRGSGDRHLPIGVAHRARDPAHVGALGERRQRSDERRPPRERARVEPSAAADGDRARDSRRRRGARAPLSVPAGRSPRVTSTVVRACRRADTVNVTVWPGRAAVETMRRHRPCRDGELRSRRSVPPERDVEAVVDPRSGPPLSPLARRRARRRPASRAPRARRRGRTSRAMPGVTSCVRIPMYA
jgi:hypothetical protein